MPLEGDPLELDAGGVTYADGAFYAIGSHGRPRHEEGKEEAKNVARGEATRRVFRIRFSPDSVGTGTGRIKPAFARWRGNLLRFGDDSAMIINTLIWIV